MTKNTIYDWRYIGIKRLKEKIHKPKINLSTLNITKEDIDGKKFIMSFDNLLYDNISISAINIYKNKKRKIFIISLLNEACDNFLNFISKNEVKNLLNTSSIDYQEITRQGLSWMDFNEQSLKENIKFIDLIVINYYNNIILYFKKENNQYIILKKYSHYYTNNYTFKDNFVFIGEKDNVKINNPKPIIKKIYKFVIRNTNKLVKEIKNE